MIKIKKNLFACSMKNSSTSKKFQTQNGMVINGRITLKKISNSKTIKKRGLQIIIANNF